MPNSAGHFSDNELAGFDESDGRDRNRVRAHIGACAACRERRAELIRLREVLAQAGQRDRQPMRTVVPSAMMRLRLRRYSVSNTNELLEGFAAFMRGFASLFALPTANERSVSRTRDAEDN